MLKEDPMTLNSFGYLNGMVKIEKTSPDAMSESMLGTSTMLQTDVSETVKTRNEQMPLQYLGSEYQSAHSGSKDKKFSSPTKGSFSTGRKKNYRSQASLAIVDHQKEKLEAMISSHREPRKSDKKMQCISILNKHN